MSSKHITNCPCCFKIFKRKGCYEKHILQCQRMNDEKTPDSAQLYKMFLTLTEKYNIVQTELDTLKRHIYTKNKKLDVLSWLNEQDDPNGTGTNNLFKCIENITISVTDLEIIFEKGFIEGTLEIITKYIQMDSSHSELIKCFEQKNNILYVFDDEWKEMKIEGFTEIMKSIYKKMLATFDDYKNVNIDKMNDDDFQLKYSDNFMKLLCVNIPFEMKCTRIKNKLYTCFKEPFKTIVEYGI